MTIDPERFEPLLAELVAMDRWGRADLVLHQIRRTERMLRHAVEVSPHYRETLGPAVAGGATLADLPALTKRTLMDEWDRIVTEPRLTLRDVEEHLASDRAAEPVLGEYRACATGGTTGERAVVVYNAAGWVQIVANVVRLLRTAGAPPGARVVGIGAPTPLHLTNRVFKDLGGPSDAPRLSVLTPVPEIVAALNAYQPEVLIVYPSSLRRLVEEHGAGRLRIRPGRILSTAEVLTPDLRTAATAAWQAPVQSAYGTTEGAVLGIECDRMAGVHLADDMVVLEAVDDEDRPVPPGTPSAKILLTTLFDSPLPLIRYEISDVVTIADEPCGCGRPSTVVSSVDGRREDRLELRTRQGEVVRLHAGRLRGPLLAVPGLRQFQVVQRSTDDLLARVSVRPGTDTDAVAATVRALLVDALDANAIELASLDVEIADEIARSGTGAKERLVGVA